MPFGKIRRLRRRANGYNFAAGCHGCRRHANGPTLRDVPPGGRARVLGYCPGLAIDHLAYLRAYGIIPGYWVRILQHSPVTVVLVEHTELALESDLACEVRVEDICY